MNRTNPVDPIYRWAYRLLLNVRWVGAKRVCRSFGSLPARFGKGIEQVYLINLDRQVHRWHEMLRELGLVYDRSNSPLIYLAERISAVDARYSGEFLNCIEVQPTYTLGDQLFVEPNSQLSREYGNDDQPVEMTRQEIAVALSHISVWRRVASSDNEYALVLEDDIYFGRNFASTMDKAWVALTGAEDSQSSFDILYVSYEEAKTGVAKTQETEILFRPVRGLWCLSGYVLTKEGAKKLLELLPVRGPVDLWFNLQFSKLRVFATQKSIINQRKDFRSDNLYSVLPVLAKVGVLTDETPSIYQAKKLPKPVFAFGEPGAGLTSLAMALSMLGYRCCSDIRELPKREFDELLSRKRSRVFDAYVNVGALFGCYTELAKKYPEAMFIVTVGGEWQWIGSTGEMLHEGKLGGPRRYAQVHDPSSVSALHHRLHHITENILILPQRNGNKWASLCEFLGCDPPNGAFPTDEDQGQRMLSTEGIRKFELARCSNLKFDPSPWIVPPRRDWRGLPTKEADMKVTEECDVITVSDNFRELDASMWELLGDTFPSNLALFDPKNFSLSNSHAARLALIKASSSVRAYKAASICTRNTYLYGQFAAEIRPAVGPGLVTGLFLHRNSPRQEIDIEFLGRDTSKMLVNVFYNPGGDGARFDFGYRGTPVLIDLGFDASAEFHQYEINWSPTAIRWFVDGELVHERVTWEPTPIPHLPMQLFVNLWPTRSSELAGKLSDECIPAYSEIRSVNLRAFPGQLAILEDSLYLAGSRGPGRGASRRSTGRSPGSRVSACPICRPSATPTSAPVRSCGPRFHCDGRSDGDLSPATEDNLLVTDIESMGAPIAPAYGFAGCETKVLLTRSTYFDNHRKLFTASATLQHIEVEHGVRPI